MIDASTPLGRFWLGFRENPVAVANIVGRNAVDALGRGASLSAASTARASGPPAQQLGSSEGEPGSPLRGAPASSWCAASDPWSA